MRGFTVCKILGVWLWISIVTFTSTSALALSSSHSCQGGTAPHERTCLFRSVCYSKRDNQLSYFAKSNQFSSLKDATQVVMGTYSTHPQLELRFEDEEKSTLQEHRVDWIESAVYFFSPSVMYYHWLVDDIFGLYWMIYHFHQVEKGSTVMIQSYDSDDSRIKNTQSIFPDYKVVNGWKGVTSTSSEDSDWVCFRNLYVGPAQKHYGGAGRATVTKEHMVEFKDYILRTFKVPTPTLRKPIITLIERKSPPRTIINHQELLEKLKTIPNVLVNSVRLEELSIGEQLKVIRNTTVLLGTHGSGLVNVLFMREGSCLLEFFPYGFSRFSYKELAQFVNVEYSYWKNEDKSKARFDSNVLNGLPEQERKIIMESPVYTRSWVANLYWVNQDTIVNVDEIHKMVIEGCLQTKLNSKLISKKKPEL